MEAAAARRVLTAPFSAKPSTPWLPTGSLHDFMHAKLTVADDTVFAGSYNLSRSGELNAENVLEVTDAARGAACGLRRRGAHEVPPLRPVGLGRQRNRSRGIAALLCTARVLPDVVDVACS